MFGWFKGATDIVTKSLDIASSIESAIDESKFTAEEKSKAKIVLKGLDLKKITSFHEVYNSDSISGNKFQSFARPSIVWLFVFIILYSYIASYLNYFNNDLFLAHIDGLKLMLGLIPDSLIWSISSVVGFISIGRSYEKGLKIKKG